MGIDQPERETIVRAWVGAVSRGDPIRVGRVALERDINADEGGGGGGGQ